MRLLVAVLLAFNLGLLTQMFAPHALTANAQPDYQIDFRPLSTAQGKWTYLESYYYADDAMRCVIFTYSSQGISPVCFDKRAQTATQP